MSANGGRSKAAATQQFALSSSRKTPLFDEEDEDGSDVLERLNHIKNKAPSDQFSDPPRAALKQPPSAERPTSSNRYTPSAGSSAGRSRTQNLTIRVEDEARIASSIHLASKKQTSGGIYNIKVDISKTGALGIGVKDLDDSVLAVSMLKRENDSLGAGESAGIRLGDIIFGINFIPTRDGSRTLIAVIKRESARRRKHLYIQAWRCVQLCSDPLPGDRFPKADDVIVQAYALYRSKAFSDWERWNFIEILLGHMVEDLKARAIASADASEDMAAAAARLAREDSPPNAGADSGSGTGSKAIANSEALERENSGSGGGYIGGEGTEGSGRENVLTLTAADRMARMKHLRLLDLERNILQAKGLRTALCVRIVYTKTMDDTVLYVLRVEDVEAGLQWAVNRRYRDFAQLNLELQEMTPFAKEVDFPRKRLTIRNSTKLVEMRIKGLEQYIRKVLQVFTAYATMDYSASEALRHIQIFLGVDRFVDCIHPPPLDDQRYIELMAYRFLNEINSPACQQCIRFISSVDLDSMAAPGDPDGYRDVLEHMSAALQEVENFVLEHHQGHMVRILRERRPNISVEQLRSFVRKCVRRQVEAAVFLPLRRTVFRIVYSYLAEKSKTLYNSMSILRQAAPDFFDIDSFVLEAKALPGTVQAFRRVIQAYLPADQGQLLIEAAYCVLELHNECNAERARRNFEKQQQLLAQEREARQTLSQAQQQQREEELRQRQQVKEERVLLEQRMMIPSPRAAGTNGASGTGAGAGAGAHSLTGAVGDTLYQIKDSLQSFRLGDGARAGGKTAMATATAAVSLANAATIVSVGTATSALLAASEAASSAANTAAGVPTSMRKSFSATSMFMTDSDLNPDGGRIGCGSSAVAAGVWEGDNAGAGGRAGGIGNAGRDKGRRVSGSSACSSSSSGSGGRGSTGTGGGGGHHVLGAINGLGCAGAAGASTSKGTGTGTGLSTGRGTASGTQRRASWSADSSFQRESNCASGNSSGGDGGSGGDQFDRRDGSRERAAAVSDLRVDSRGSFSARSMSSTLAAASAAGARTGAGAGNRHSSNLRGGIASSESRVQRLRSSARASFVQMFKSGTSAEGSAAAAAPGEAVENEDGIGENQSKSQSKQQLVSATNSSESDIFVSRETLYDPVARIFTPNQGSFQSDDTRSSRGGQQNDGDQMAAMKSPTISATPPEPMSSSSINIGGLVSLGVSSDVLGSSGGTGVHQQIPLDLSRCSSRFDGWDANTTERPISSRNLQTPQGAALPPNGGCQNSSSIPTPIATPTATATTATATAAVAVALVHEGVSDAAPIDLVNSVAPMNRSQGKFSGDTGADAHAAQPLVDAVTAGSTAEAALREQAVEGKEGEREEGGEEVAQDGERAEEDQEKDDEASRVFSVNEQSLDDLEYFEQQRQERRLQEERRANERQMLLETLLVSKGDCSERCDDDDDGEGANDDFGGEGGDARSGDGQSLVGGRYGKGSAGRGKGGGSVWAGGAKRTSSSHSLFGDDSEVEAAPGGGSSGRAAQRRDTAGLHNGLRHTAAAGGKNGGGIGVGIGANGKAVGKAGNRNSSGIGALIESAAESDVGAAACVASIDNGQRALLNLTLAIRKVSITAINTSSSASTSPVVMDELGAGGKRGSSLSPTARGLSPRSGSGTPSPWLLTRSGSSNQMVRVTVDPLICPQPQLQPRPLPSSLLQDLAQEPLSADQGQRQTVDSRDRAPDGIAGGDEREDEREADEQAAGGASEQREGVEGAAGDGLGGGDSGEEHAHRTERSRGGGAAGAGFSDSQQDRLSSDNAEAMQQAQAAAQQSVLSADDFLPLFTYSLVQAGLPQLLLVKELMVSLTNDEDTYGELGYYLATMEAATQHISDLARQYEKLGKVEKLFNGSVHT